MKIKRRSSKQSTHNRNVSNNVREQLQARKNTFLHHLLLGFFLLFATGLAQAEFGATIITHGYGSDADSWVRDMGVAILNRAGRGQLWKFDASLDSLQDITSLARSGGSGRAQLNPEVATDSEGEQVILVDWRHTANNTLISPAGHAEAVGHALYSLLMGSVSSQPDFVGPAGNRKPLHFIAHSFGSVVNSEAIQRLGLQGIEVEQMTTLDPHDWGENLGDLPDVDGDALLPDVHVWSNVVRADNYFESEGFNGGCLLCFNPHGRFLEGAKNFDLSSFDGFHGTEQENWGPKPHSRVHTFYHGTIDPIASELLSAGHFWTHH